MNKSILYNLFAYRPEFWPDYDVEQLEDKKPTEIEELNIKFNWTLDTSPDGCTAAILGDDKVYFKKLEDEEDSIFLTVSLPTQLIGTHFMKWSPDNRFLAIIDTIGNGFVISTETGEITQELTSDCWIAADHRGSSPQFIGLETRIVKNCSINVSGCLELIAIAAPSVNVYIYRIHVSLSKGDIVHFGFGNDGLKFGPLAIDSHLEKVTKFTILNDQLILGGTLHNDDVEGKGKLHVHDDDEEEEGDTAPLDIFDILDKTPWITNVPLSQQELEKTDEYVDEDDDDDEIPNEDDTTHKSKKTKNNKNNINKNNNTSKWSLASLLIPQRIRDMFKSQNGVYICDLRAHPSGRLAFLDSKHQVSLFDTISGTLKSWKPQIVSEEDLPGAEMMYDVGISNQEYVCTAPIKELRFWDEDSLVFAHEDGSLAIVDFNAKCNLLGGAVEHFSQPLVLSSRMSGTSKNELCLLECETVEGIVKREWHEVSDKPAQHVTAREYCLKALAPTTPSELLLTKLRLKDFGSALRLARTHDLDQGLVFKFKWRDEIESGALSPLFAVDGSSQSGALLRYLQQVKDQEWVLRELVSARLAKRCSIASLRKLFNYGIEIADSMFLRIAARIDDERCENDDVNQRGAARIVPERGCGLHAVDWSAFNAVLNSTEYSNGNDMRLASFAIKSRMLLLQHLRRLATYQKLHVSCVNRRPVVPLGEILNAPVLTPENGMINCVINIRQYRLFLDFDHQSLYKFLSTPTLTGLCTSMAATGNIELLNIMLTSHFAEVMPLRPLFLQLLPGTVNWNDISCWLPSKPSVDKEEEGVESKINENQQGEEGFTCVINGNAVICNHGFDLEIDDKYMDPNIPFVPVWPKGTVIEIVDCLVNSQSIFDSAIEDGICHTLALDWKKCPVQNGVLSDSASAPISEPSKYLATIYLFKILQLDGETGSISRAWDLCRRALRRLDLDGVLATTEPVSNAIDEISYDASDSDDDYGNDGDEANDSTNDNDEEIESLAAIQWKSLSIEESTLIMVSVQLQEMNQAVPENELQMELLSGPMTSLYQWIHTPLVDKISWILHTLCKKPALAREMITKSLLPMLRIRKRFALEEDDSNAALLESISEHLGIVSNPLQWIASLDVDETNKNRSPVLDWPLMVKSSSESHIVVMAMIQMLENVSEPNFKEVLTVCGALLNFGELESNELINAVINIVEMALSNATLWSSSSAAKCTCLFFDSIRDLALFHADECSKELSLQMLQLEERFIAFDALCLATEVNREINKNNNNNKHNKEDDHPLFLLFASEITKWSNIITNHNSAPNSGEDGDTGKGSISKKEILGLIKGLRKFLSICGDFTERENPITHGALANRFNTILDLFTDSCGCPLPHNIAEAAALQELLASQNWDGAARLLKIRWDISAVDDDLPDEHIIDIVVSVAHDLFDAVATIPTLSEENVNDMFSFEKCLALIVNDEQMIDLVQSSSTECPALIQEWKLHMAFRMLAEFPSTHDILPAQIRRITPMKIIFDILKCDSDAYRKELFSAKNARVLWLEDEFGTLEASNQGGDLLMLAVALGVGVEAELLQIRLLVAHAAKKENDFPLCFSLIETLSDICHVPVNSRVREVLNPSTCQEPSLWSLCLDMAKNDSLSMTIRFNMCDDAVLLAPSQYLPTVVSYQNLLAEERSQIEWFRILDESCIEVEDSANLIGDADCLLKTCLKCLEHRFCPVDILQSGVEMMCACSRILNTEQALSIREEMVERLIIGLPSVQNMDAEYFMGICLELNEDRLVEVLDRRLEIINSPKNISEGDSESVASSPIDRVRTLNAELDLTIRVALSAALLSNNSRSLTPIIDWLNNDGLTLSAFLSSASMDKLMIIMPALAESQFVKFVKTLCARRGLMIDVLLVVDLLDNVCVDRYISDVNYRVSCIERLCKLAASYGGNNDVTVGVGVDVDVDVGTKSSRALTLAIRLSETVMDPVTDTPLMSKFDVSSLYLVAFNDSMMNASDGNSTSATVFKELGDHFRSQVKQSHLKALLNGHPVEAIDLVIDLLTKQYCGDAHAFIGFLLNILKSSMNMCGNDSNVTNARNLLTTQILSMTSQQKKIFSERIQNRLKLLSGCVGSGIDVFKLFEERIVPYVGDDNDYNIPVSLLLNVCRSCITSSNSDQLFSAINTSSLCKECSKELWIGLLMIETVQNDMINEIRENRNSADIKVSKRFIADEISANQRIHRNRVMFSSVTPEIIAIVVCKACGIDINIIGYELLEMTPKQLQQLNGGNVVDKSNLEHMLNMLLKSPLMEMNVTEIMPWYTEDEYSPSPPAVQLSSHALSALESLPQRASNQKLKRKAKKLSQTPLLIIKRSLSLLNRVSMGLTDSCLKMSLSREFCNGFIQCGADTKQASSIVNSFILASCGSLSVSSIRALTTSVLGPKELSSGCEILPNSLFQVLYSTKEEDCEDMKRFISYIVTTERQCEAYDVKDALNVFSTHICKWYEDLTGAEKGDYCFDSNLEWSHLKSWCSFMIHIISPSNVMVSKVVKELLLQSCTCFENLNIVHRALSLRQIAVDVTNKLTKEIIDSIEDKIENIDDIHRIIMNGSVTERTLVISMVLNGFNDSSTAHELLCLWTHAEVCDLSPEGLAHAFLHLRSDDGMSTEEFIELIVDGEDIELNTLLVDFHSSLNDQWLAYGSVWNLLCVYLLKHCHTSDRSVDENSLKFEDVANHLDSETFLKLVGPLLFEDNVSHSIVCSALRFLPFTNASCSIWEQLIVCLSQKECINWGVSSDSIAAGVFVVLLRVFVAGRLGTNSEAIEQIKNMFIPFLEDEKSIESVLIRHLRPSSGGSTSLVENSPIYDLSLLTGVLEISEQYALGRKLQRQLERGGKSEAGVGEKFANAMDRFLAPSTKSKNEHGREAKEDGSGLLGKVFKSFW